MRAAHLLLLIATSFALPALGASKAGEATSSRTDEVRAVVESFVTAWNRHRIDDLTSLFTASGAFKSPAGTSAQSRSGIRNLLVREHAVYREATLPPRPKRSRFRRLASPSPREPTR